MLNIVVPMAGRGSRFADAGYTKPKPLIDVFGLPMIQYVIANLRPRGSHRFIFIVLGEHEREYRVSDTLKRLSPGCEVISLDSVTEGAACTVLMARDLINNETPLMIANSDQWVDVAIDEYLAKSLEPGVSGLIMTMRADDPKWSFVRLDGKGAITEVVEKQVVSNEATVGIYNFTSGSQFVEAAEEMIAKDLRVNNEFYVAPVYNGILKQGGRIEFFNVGAENEGMYGLGIPSDLEKFLAMNVSSKALEQAKALNGTDLTIS